MGKNNFSSSPLVVGVAVKNSIAVVVTEWRWKPVYITTSRDGIEFVRRQFAAFAALAVIHGSVSISKCGGPFRRHAEIFAHAPRWRCDGHHKIAVFGH